MKMFNSLLLVTLIPFAAKADPVPANIKTLREAFALVCLVGFVRGFKSGSDKSLSKENLLNAELYCQDLAEKTVYENPK